MTTKQLHSRTTGFGIAMGLPIADAIDHVIASARELDAAAEKTHHAQDFGSRIAQAVRRKTPCPAVCSAAPRKDDDEDDDETEEEKQKDDSFAERLKKAVRKRQRTKSE
jgi:hypothetical protein